MKELSTRTESSLPHRPPERSARGGARPDVDTGPAHQLGGRQRVTSTRSGAGSPETTAASAAGTSRSYRLPRSAGQRGTSPRTTRTTDGTSPRSAHSSAWDSQSHIALAWTISWMSPSLSEVMCSPSPQTRRLAIPCPGGWGSSAITSAARRRTASGLLNHPCSTPRLSAGRAASAAEDSTSTRSEESTLTVVPASPVE